MVDGLVPFRLDFHDCIVKKISITSNLITKMCSKEITNYDINHNNTDLNVLKSYLNHRFSIMSYCSTGATEMQ
jgi:hypothetical protein